MQTYILGVIDLLKKDSIEESTELIHGIIKGFDDEKFEAEKLFGDLYEMMRMLEEGYLDRKDVMDSIKSYRSTFPSPPIEAKNESTREALSELIKKLEKPSSSPRRSPIKELMS